MKRVVMMNKRKSCFLPREISQNVDELFKTRKKIKIDLYDNFFCSLPVSTYRKFSMRRFSFSDCQSSNISLFNCFQVLKSVCQNFVVTTGETVILPVGLSDSSSSSSKSYGSDSSPSFLLGFL